jgi:hypothetical protein
MRRKAYSIAAAAKEPAGKGIRLLWDGRLGRMQREYEQLAGLRLSNSIPCDRFVSILRVSAKR